MLTIVTGTTNLSEPVKEVIKQIQEKTSKSGQAMIINGMFGDMTECDGVVEEIKDSPQGGIFVKAFGSPHLFKGVPRKEVVDMLNLPKAFISLVPRELFRSKLTIFYFACLYLFSRKHFWHTLRTIFHRIHDLSLTRIQYPDVKKYSQPVRMLRSAFDETIRQLYEIDINSKQGLTEETNYIGPREKWITLTCIVRLICEFIENDNAYRLKVQDIFKEYKRKNIQKDTRKEILRLLDILIKRENQNLMTEKWEFIRKVASITLRLKSVKKFARYYFLLIEQSQMIPDDDDWYMSLRRDGYNFGGLSLKERLKIKKKIDKKRGHIPMQKVQLKVRDVIINNQAIEAIKTNIDDPTKINNLKNIILNLPQVNEMRDGIRII